MTVTTVIWDAFSLKNQCLMCQTCGHSGLTLDLIINIAGLLTLGLLSDVRKKRRARREKGIFKAVGWESSDAIQSVSTCVRKMDTWRSVFRWAWWPRLMWCFFSTPALPSVPLHSLWPRRFLAHNKYRTGALMNTPHSRPFEGTGKASVAYFKKINQKKKQR